MKHEMVFYGTGAAQGIPSPFCACEVCQNAREQGGHEIRRRTMFRVNEEVCVDLGADSFQQALDFGDFINLHHVLVTHTHEDHFTTMMLNVRGMSPQRTQEPLHFYLTDKAYEMADFLRGSPVIIKGKTSELEKNGVIAFHRLAFGESSRISGLEVTPLKGNHFGNMDEHSANFLIGLPDKRRLYYGLDTGWYLPETLEALKNASLDILISECTFGLTPGRGDYPDGHLDAFACMKLFELLLKQGTLRPDTQIILTHINHCTSTGAELACFFVGQDFPCPITISYDGMQIR